MVPDLIWRDWEAHHIITRQGKELSFSNLLKSNNKLIGMKKLIVFLLLGASFILCTLLYLKYDSKGFDYGFGCIFCEERMPYRSEERRVGKESTFMCIEAAANSTVEL